MPIKLKQHSQPIRPRDHTQKLIPMGTLFPNKCRNDVLELSSHILLYVVEEK